ncbi:hypothetical protein VTP01DRAFT_3783 [Rhizomucor pusillus]|uniref:uncharacterized protein n=1 Tax=Rhizomucor pusillus TaxID=4840 RepID=UPI003743015A
MYVDASNVTFRNMIRLRTRYDLCPDPPPPTSTFSRLSFVFSFATTAMHVVLYFSRPTPREKVRGLVPRVIRGLPFRV